MIHWSHFFQLFSTNHESGLFKKPSVHMMIMKKMTMKKMMMMVKKMMMMMMRTCDDVERVGGWGECGGGGDGERGVADHWHRVTPDHHYHYSDFLDD